jgi:hypothetical protein
MLPRAMFLAKERVEIPVGSIIAVRCLIWIPETVPDVRTCFDHALVDVGGFVGLGSQIHRSTDGVLHISYSRKRRKCGERPHYQCQQCGEQQQSSNENSVTENSFMIASCRR